MVYLPLVALLGCRPVLSYYAVNASGSPLELRLISLDSAGQAALLPSEFLCTRDTIVKRYLDFKSFTDTLRSWHRSDTTFLTIPPYSTCFFGTDGHDELDTRIGGFAVSKDTNSLVLIHGRDFRYRASGPQRGIGWWTYPRREASKKLR